MLASAGVYGHAHAYAYVGTMHASATVYVYSYSYIFQNDASGLQNRNVHLPSLEMGRHAFQLIW